MNTKSLVCNILLQNIKSDINLSCGLSVGRVAGRHAVGGDHLHYALRQSAQRLLGSSRGRPLREQHQPAGHNGGGEGGDTF